MNLRARAALLSLLTLFLVRAPGLSAQASMLPAFPPPSGPNVSPAAHVGPTQAALSVAVRTAVPVESSHVAAGNAGLGQNEALMIVGGAAILVGAVVGGDAGDFFMIGGAIVGLYGLYKYLQ